jgi:hypothetical protein
MKLTGNIKIHKSDGVTRQAKCVIVLDNGELAVWDKQKGEPDILVSEDKWERVEREGHSWRQSSYSNVMEEAKERDDVNEDLLEDNL